jgi:hypothetical protein
MYVDLFIRFVCVLLASPLVTNLWKLPKEETSTVKHCRFVDVNRISSSLERSRCSLLLRENFWVAWMWACVSSLSTLKTPPPLHTCSHTGRNVVSLILCECIVPEYWGQSVPTRGSYITRYVQFWSKSVVRTSRAVEKIEVMIVTLVSTNGPVPLLQHRHERWWQLWSA